MRALLLFAAVFMAPVSGICAGYITYEQFGAVGDGVHDDQSAIVAAHAAANQSHQRVRAKDGATYYIGRGSEVAVIRTDVDFGTARFIIDDVGTDDYRAPIFKVESYEKPFAVEGVAPLRKGQTSLGVTLPSRCLVEVTNDARRVYIRRGLNQNNGTSQKEMLLVGKDGSIDPSAPVIWDYESLEIEGDASLEGRLGIGGFNAPVKAWPVDRRRLTIRGGTFITIANTAASEYNYYSRNIVIARSNVLLEGLSHYVIGEGSHGAPYSGFVTVNHAADVIVRDCLLTPHKTYVTIGSAGAPVKMGSYDMEAQFCIGLVVKNLRQTINIDNRDYWGLFASNFCKNITMSDCVVSRFDAHMGVCNVTLTDCTFGYMGVQFVGFGTARIENCEVRRDTFVMLRSDYGSSWDGNIILRNCRLVLPGGSKSAFVISGSNDGHHDFGYACRLPELVDIDGLTIDDSKAAAGYSGPRLYGTFNRDVTESGILPFPADGRIVLDNISTASDKPLEISDNKAMFPICPSSI